MLPVLISSASFLTPGGVEKPSAVMALVIGCTAAVLIAFALPSCSPDPVYTVTGYGDINHEIAKLANTYKATTTETILR